MRKSTGARLEVRGRRLNSKEGVLGIEPQTSILQPSTVLTSDRGIALPLVMWVITVMSAIVLSFSLVARTESRSVFHFRGDVEKRLLAQGGIERAIMEISYGELFSSKEDDRLEELVAWKADGRPYTFQLGKGSCKVHIQDEAGKIPINTLSTVTGVMLKNLLTRFGSSEEEADTIVDSILDWKDADNLHRLHGAESDYYMSLPTPYKAKDANFDTLEELLLVKGMTRDILYGNTNRKGLLQYVTVYSTQQGVNIMTAPREVLLSLPGITEAAVDRIITYRDAAERQQGEDASAILGENQAALSRFISAGDQNTFTVTSVGLKEGEKKVYIITATLVLAEGGKYKYLYYKSPSEMNQ